MNLRDSLLKKKKDYESEYIIFYTDGTTSKEQKNFVLKEEEKITDRYTGISSMLGDAVDYYSREKNPFDQMTMKLNIGIIYKKEDVNEDGTLKENAKPLKNKVHYYTSDIEAYDKGEKVKTYSYSNFYHGRQAFMDYENLVKNSKLEGIEFYGPESFEALKENILAKRKSDIILLVSFEQEKSLVLRRK